MSMLWQRNDTTQIFPVLQLEPQLENQSEARVETNISPGSKTGFQIEESKLKLSLQTRYHGDVVIFQCRGRIAYRDEAATFSHLVRESLRDGAKVVLDLRGVTLIDCAGMGELAALHVRARSKKADLKYAQLQPWVRRHLEITRVTAFLEIYRSLPEALTAFDAQYSEICAGC